MKILFFLLALANVTLFMWEYHKGAFSTAAEASLDNATDYPEQIVLVSELTGNTSIASQTDKAPISADDHSVDANVKNERDEKSENVQFLSEALTDINSSVPETSMRKVMPIEPEISAAGQGETKSVSCLEAGPFATEQIYKIWAKRLNGFIQDFNKEEPVVKDYLVYYPAAETMLLSQANLQMLKDKGINDFWLFTQGADQGQISLGVFNREEQALILKNDLVAKGIAAEIKARTKNKVQKFAAIRGESEVTENLELLKKAYPNVTVKQTASPGAENCF